MTKLSQNISDSSLLINLLWGFISVGIIVTLFVEKILFDEYFESSADFGIIGGIFIGLMIILIMFTKYASKAMLIIGLFVSSILSAIFWIVLAQALPIDPEFKYSNSWIFSQMGQIILISLNFLINPALVHGLSSYLLDEKEDINSYLTTKRISRSTIFAGIILSVLGFIALAGYYWSIMFLGLIMAIQAIVLLILGPKWIENASKDSSENSKHNIHLSHALVRLIIVACVSLFGFSMLDHQVFRIELLIPFGSGILIYSIVFLFLMIFLKNDEHIMIWIEGIALIVLLLCLGVLTTLYYDGILTEEADMVIGIPAFIAGFLFAILLEFMKLNAIGNTAVKFQAKIPIKLFSARNHRIWSSLWMLLIIFVIMAIRINPADLESLIAYVPGLLLAIIGIVLWLKACLKFTKNTSSKSA
jgi:hypothetical protein